MRDIFILYRLNPLTYQPVKEGNNWGLSSNRYTCTHRTENKGNNLLFDFGILIEVGLFSVYFPISLHQNFSVFWGWEGKGEECFSPPIACLQH